MPLRHLRFTAFLVIALACLGGCSAGDTNTLTEFNGMTMGTTYSIKITNLPDNVRADDLQHAINATLAAVNSSMSTYIDDSELSRVNKAGSDHTLTLSEPLHTVITEAIRISMLSDGAFDITVGPLVNLWGFGPQAEPEHIPDDTSIEQARALTGMDKIVMNDSRRELRKLHSDVYLDLSAIAKGYGVDRVARLLENYRIENYMVEIGGEIKVRGINDRDTPWHIAIEKPDASVRQALYVIEPGSRAVATSGDYRNYYERDGVRYSHTINPRTGRPIDHTLASVTVLADSCMTADGLATAFMVLGPDTGFELAQQQNIAALFLVKTADGFETRVSSAFEPFYRH